MATKKKKQEAAVAVSAEPFTTFSKAVATRWQELTSANTTLFRSSVTKDVLWDTYLAAWPEGTNEIHKTRREHDCQTCRQFVRAVGGVITIVDGKMATIWDLDRETTPYTYLKVADAMAALVRAFAIDNVFLHTERTAGALKSHAQDDAGTVVTWNHFFVNLPSAFVVPGADIGTKQAETRSTHDVFLRGLREITPEAVDTVLELIAQDSLYRGAEQKHALQGFQRFQNKFPVVAPEGTLEQAQDLYAWANVGFTHAITRIRNTSIGTLLVDLSNGEELEKAVLSFEAKLNPVNYKRPTALVSKAQIERAQKAVEELGLTSALERRYAVAEDITTNNVLFVDRSTKLRGSKTAEAFGVLASKATVSKVFNKVEEVSIDKFLADVLPGAASLELLVENKHTGNLVSLIAPVDPTAKQLFKWSNNFSWTYAGNVTDSMRERVEKLGGRVNGALRFTHAWNHPEMGRNSSLMDLHVFMPGNIDHPDGCHERYPSGRRVGWNHRDDGQSGGRQDVDYTAAAPEGYVPVENIAFPTLAKLPEGKYVFKIHNWSLRPPTTSGFKAEIEVGGQIYQYEHPQPLKQKEWVTLAEAVLKDGVFTITHKLTEQKSSRQLWGLTTQTFVKVNLAMLSPNHWDDAGVGNKHYFFMLDDCKNEDTARGFYNEFLDSRLDAHRKTLELVGAKMRTDESDRQLSGLGFSSTQRSQITVRVKGAIERVLKVNI